MSDKEENTLLKDTISQERLQVINMVRRLGSKLSGLLITCGLLVLAFGIYLLVFPQQDPVLSTRLNFVFMGAFGLMGGLNIMCGLLLLLGEG